MNSTSREFAKGEDEDGNKWTGVTCTSLELVVGYLAHASCAVCASDRNVRAMVELTCPVHAREVHLVNRGGLYKDRTPMIKLLVPMHAVRFSFDNEHQEYAECIVDVRDVRTVERVLWWLQVAAVRSLRLEGVEHLSTAGIHRLFSSLLTKHPLTEGGRALPTVLEELTCNGSSAYHTVRLKDVSLLQQCLLLKKIHMDWCWSLKSLDGVESFASLETLRIPGTQVSDWKALAECPRLKYLDMSCTEGWVSLSGMETLTSLVTLELAYTPIKDLRPLRGNKQLRNVSLNHCTQLRSLAGLEGLLALEVLDLSGTAVDRLTPLHDCRQLRHLQVVGCTELRSLAGLENSLYLDELVLAESAVESLVPLRDCHRLKKLNLKACRQLRTLAGLEYSSELEELVLLDSAVESLVPLQEGCRLKKFHMKYCDQLRSLIGNHQEEKMVDDIYNRDNIGEHGSDFIMKD
ncbi:adenylate cyclase regulatory protein-like protein [Strigomonas culicis]|uniref:Adenylate cyclase regulatory protein-like protein n=1 Tax=Strigomonas culicis TaxID=28005 RepID=S9TJA8_9TRYP|nr:adenylate cyclase regulatory protein-like protein [Strigomonas culicis]|eukprot:EPY18137.1 adenylate cyclase regulatory protein-like protein [Strigomonas culicis]